MVSETLGCNFSYQITGISEEEYTQVKAEKLHVLPRRPWRGFIFTQKAAQVQNISVEGTRFWFFIPDLGQLLPQPVHRGAGTHVILNGWHLMEEAPPPPVNP